MKIRGLPLPHLSLRSIDCKPMGSKNAKAMPSPKSKPKAAAAPKPFAAARASLRGGGGGGGLLSDQPYSQDRNEPYPEDRGKRGRVAFPIVCPAAFEHHAGIRASRKALAAVPIPLPKPSSHRLRLF